MLVLASQIVCPFQLEAFEQYFCVFAIRDGGVLLKGDDGSGFFHGLPDQFESKVCS